MFFMGKVAYHLFQDSFLIDQKSAKLNPRDIVPLRNLTTLTNSRRALKSHDHL